MVGEPKKKGNGSKKESPGTAMPSHDGHPVVRETYNIPDCMYNSKLLIAVLALSIAGLFHVEGFTFNLSRLGSAKLRQEARQTSYKICQSINSIDIITGFNVIYVLQVATVVLFKNTFGPAQYRIHSF